jgi:hypothetical protein
LANVILRGGAARVPDLMQQESHPAKLRRLRRWLSMAMQRRGDQADREPIDLMVATAFPCALAYSIWILAEGWSHPLLDFHGWRQTQTAITVYWIAQGGPLLDYLTPVLGAPWTVPFEFPLFQWVVAALYRFLPITLDSAGRAVSYAFFIVTLWPLYLLCKYLGYGINKFLIAATLLLLSPIYLFYSRTFLIESTALFFSFMFVASVQAYLTKNRGIDLAMATIVGTVAALVKITTFPAFAFAASLLVLRDFVQNGTKWNISFLLRRCGLLCIPALVPLLAILAWIAHADLLKSNSLFGQYLTSGNLTGFNYGTLAQRLSGTLWRDVIFGRSLHDALGSPIVFWAAAAAVIFCSRESILYFVLLIALYVSPFLLFTNLHIVHGYYQYANALFVVMAVALVVAQLRSRLPRWAFGGLFIAICLVQMHTFAVRFEPAVAGSQEANPTLALSRALARNTPVDSVVFIFGQRWSPEIPYYSKRKGVEFPLWASAFFPAVLDQPNMVTGGLPLSAVVSCGAVKSPSLAAVIDNFLAKFEDGSVVAEVKDCKLFIKDPMSGIIGSNLDSKFTILDAKQCIGDIDAVWRTDRSGTFGVTGWAWDAAAIRTPRHILLVDNSKTIRGIAYPILARPDVPHAFPAVRDPNVGWRGFTNEINWPLSAYSVQAGGVCRLGNARAEPQPH